MQAKVNEHSKTLKTYRREGGQQGAQGVWCKRSFPKKIKNRNSKVKISNS